MMESILKVVQGWVKIKGASDGTMIGNSMSALHVNLRDIDNIPLETILHRLVVVDSFRVDLLNNKLFCASIVAFAATAGTDNPIFYLVNPIDSGKQIIIKRVMVCIGTTNVAMTFKAFTEPSTTTVVSNISSISQGALSITVTVTTTTNNGASIGAQVVIAGTNFFNGTYTVTGVTSPTIFTFTKSAPLLPISDNTGTSTVSSSLGTSIPIYAMKRTNTPATSIAFAYRNSILTSNGNQMLAVSQGQNSSPPILVGLEEILLDPGHSLLITADPSSNNREASISVIWGEE